MTVNVYAGKNKIVRKLASWYKISTNIDYSCCIQDK